MRALFETADGALRAPWRIVLFFGVTFVAGGLIGGLVYPLVALTPLVQWAREYRVPLDQLGALLALGAASWFCLRLDGRGVPAWTRVGLARADWNVRSASYGFAVGALAILVPCALLLATGRFSFENVATPESWWVATRSALFILTPAALVEELAMRGYPFTALRESLGAGWAVALTSIVFALLHLFNPAPTMMSTATVALAGVLLAAVRLATGSLVAAWTAHLAWNLMQAAALHAPVSGLPLGTPGYRLLDHGPVWLTGGAWGPEGGLAAAAGMLVATFLLLRRGNRLAVRATGEDLLSATTVEN